MAALTAQSSGFLPEYSKEKYPVVCSVIKENELENVKKINAFEEVSLAKVLKLLTDKHSKKLINRHHRAIKRLCLCNKHGIHLRDVKLIIEILKRCYEYINVDSSYEESVCMLLSLFQNPFLKSKVLDEGTFLQVISDSLSELGYLAESSSDKIKCEISTSISMLYTYTPTLIHSTDIQPVSPEFIRKATGLSTICKSIAECLVQVSNNDSKYTVLEALNHLSDTNITCNDILKTNAAACICASLKILVRNYKLIVVAVETLWNILEHGSSDQIAEQLSSEQCLSSLKSVFIQKINDSPSHADQQLRNDIFVLVTLVVSKCPNAPLVESGLAKMIAGYASYPELPTGDGTICHVKFTKRPEDFELKKLFISTINILCVNTDDYSVLQFLSQYQVILALFSYVKPIRQPLEGFWDVVEFEELQLQAMSVLAAMCPLLVEDYIKFQGNTRLLSVLDWCVNFEDFSGHGNSFYGTGGRSSKRAQMRYCIRLLRSMCATGNAAVAQDLADQGTIAQLVAILNSCSNSSDSNDKVDIELQCDMLFILASLCEGDIHRKELFGELGVKMLLQYLHGYLNAKKGPLYHDKMVLSTVDCIWSSVIGCYLNEIHFLECEGAFMLLDLLEVCPEKMKNIVLGALVDLTERNNTLMHVNLWRGKEQKTVGKLLVELWRNEEQRLGVKRCNNIVISDPTRPLKTAQQEEDQYSLVLPSSYPSAAIVDVSDNLRSKLYGMFSRIGFNNVPGLVPSDYVTLIIIEKYLDFKTLEIWQEIQEELQMEKIEPVSPDRECIDAIISFTQEKASDIAKVQQLLITNNFEQELLEEREFYNEIKESHTQEEKSHQDFVNFVGRTSDYNILKKARKDQLKIIERSRLISQGTARLDDSLILHNTMNTTLNTTSFCGRNINVKSTIFGGNVTQARLDTVKTIEFEHWLDIIQA